MIFRFVRYIALTIIVLAFAALPGCIYDFAPSGPIRNIDTWLLGQWATQDASGHQLSSVVTRADVDHYDIQLHQAGHETLHFSAWISRVDDFSILVLRSLNEGETYGKFSLYHYEILTKSKPSDPGDIGANRIRLSELELDESARTLDSYHLRAAIRKALKDGTLLLPHNVVADLKSKNEKIPGSIIWTKTASVTFHGETF